MGDVSDPRVKNRSTHKLLDVIVISVLGTLCGANSFYDLVAFAEAKEKFLRKFLELPGGIPSHDTFLRVLSIINPTELEICFLNWMDDLRKKVKEDVLCLDGKVSRGTIKSELGQFKNRLSTVSVYSTETQLVLGQLKSSGSGLSEVKSAIDLLDLLTIKDQIIVCDAGIGSSSVASKVIEKKGNYLFPIKKNSKMFYSALDDLFTTLNKNKSLKGKAATAVIQENHHGRKEKRTLRILKLKDCPENLNFKNTGEEYFKKALVIGEIVYRSVEKETRPFIAISNKKNGTLKYQRRDQVTNAKETRIKEEKRYFITSLDRSPAELASIIRKQWAIENQLHWILDVCFEEDDNKTRSLIAANNLSTMRKIAFNIIKSTPSKSSIKGRMKKAGWDDNYLEELITQNSK